MKRAFLLFLLISAAGCGEGTIRTAPSFRLETLDHKRFYLSETRGEVVLLLFWDTTCVVCKKEMALLEPVRRKERDRGLRVVTLCTDPENRDALERIAGSLPLDAPILLDVGGKVAHDYGATVRPTTVLLDRKGVERFRLEGFGDDDLDALHLEIRRLLEEPGGKE